MGKRERKGKREPLTTQTHTYRTCTELGSGKEEFQELDNRRIGKERKAGEKK